MSTAGSLLGLRQISQLATVFFKNDRSLSEELSGMNVSVIDDQIFVF